MNVLLHYIRKKRYLYLILSILFIFGFGTGIFVGFQNQTLIQTQLLQFSNQIQGITFQGMCLHFGILSFLVISSMFVIGIPFFLAFFFIEGVSIGIILMGFLNVYQFKGLCFAIIFLLIVYFIFLVGLYILFPKCLELARSVIAKIIYKRENEIHILKTLQSGLVLVFLLGINDLFLVFTSTKFLSIFRFLLS